MQVFEDVFGSVNGQDIPVITLTNSKDISIKAIPFGAHLIEWSVPDNEGKFDNITLGFDELAPYLLDRPFYGATVGRVAGRIRDGKFTLDGKAYQLPVNQNGSHLHGGMEGLDTKIWDYKTSKSESEASVIFTYVDAEGSNDYPGTLTVEVTYTLTEKDEWKINYRATTDKPTLFNPTNHVYFNLHGDYSQDILNHHLFVGADQYGELDERTLPTGRSLPVAETPFDFRQATPIDQILNMDHPQTKLVNGLDHPFVLNHTRDLPDAILEDKKTGRSIHMRTDQPVVVIYTHNGPKEDLGIMSHTGITLETQGYPDAVNHDHFGTIVLRPGEVYESETSYHFKLI